MTCDNLSCTRGPPVQFCRQLLVGLMTSCVDNAQPHVYASSSQRCGAPEARCAIAFRFCGGFVEKTCALYSACKFLSVYLVVTMVRFIANLHVKKVRARDSSSTHPPYSPLRLKRRRHPTPTSDGGLFGSSRPPTLVALRLRRSRFPHSSKWSLASSVGRKWLGTTAPAARSSS